MAQKLQVTTVNAATDEQHHFFASSAAEWKVDTDPAALVAYMKKQGYGFNLWMVPGPQNSAYGIKMYAPQVEGAVWLAAYLYE